MTKYAGGTLGKWTSPSGPLTPASNGSWTGSRGSTMSGPSSRPSPGGRAGEPAAQNLDLGRPGVPGGGLGAEVAGAGHQGPLPGEVTPGRVGQPAGTLAPHRDTGQRDRGGGEDSPQRGAVDDPVAVELGDGGGHGRGGRDGRPDEGGTTPGGGNGQVERRGGTRWGAQVEEPGQ